MKQEAIRELLRLKEQLKQDRGYEDYRAREMYEYLSKSSVNKLQSKDANFRNFDKPMDYPMRPRNYAKIFEVKEDYEDYYARMKNQLDDVSHFVPLRESKLENYLKALPNPKQGNKSAANVDQDGLKPKGDLTDRSHKSGKGDEAKEKAHHDLQNMQVAKSQGQIDPQHTQHQTQPLDNQAQHQETVNQNPPADFLVTMARQDAGQQLTKEGNPGVQSGQENTGTTQNPPADFLATIAKTGAGQLTEENAAAEGKTDGKKDKKGKKEKKKK